MKYEKPEIQSTGSAASCIQGQGKGSGGPFEGIVDGVMVYFTPNAYEADE